MALSVSALSLFKNVTIIPKTFLASSFSSYKVSKDIKLHSERSDKFVNPNSFKVHEIEKKPLVVLLPWLSAKERYVNKFVQYYLRNNMDVVEARVNGWQVLLPKSGAQVVARDLLKFLKINKAYSPLLVHGFSVGGYLWGEVLLQMHTNPNTGYPFKTTNAEADYDTVKSKIVGQIWDSAVPFQGACKGLAATICPENKVMQESLRRFIQYLFNMTIFHDIATRHHIKSSEMFHKHSIRAPAKLLVSKSDPIGCAEMNKKLKDQWVENGMKVYMKCWHKSPHVQHFRYYPEEYMEELNKFLVVINLMTDNNYVYPKGLDD